MKANYVAYFDFQKDVDVDEAIYCTSSETKADTHDQYIGYQLQIPDNDGMKQMARVHQRFSDADVNPEGNSNYRVWTDHTEYEI